MSRGRKSSLLYRQATASSLWPTSGRQRTLWGWVIGGR